MVRVKKGGKVYAAIPREAATSPKPPIPLIPEITDEIPKGKKIPKVEYTLMVNPQADDSATCKETVYKFSTGSTEELLKLIEQIGKVFKGMRLTTGPTQYQVWRTILQGDALRALEKKASEFDTETVANLKSCVEAVKSHVFPKNALFKQISYMRTVTKPKTMSIKTYILRMVELNEYIPQFPNADETNKFEDTALKFIIESAIPNSWRRKLYESDFYPAKETLEALVGKLEAYEDVEGSDFEIPKKPRGSGVAKMPRSSSLLPQSGEAKFFCELHRENNSHNTDKCYTIKKLRKSLGEKKKPAHSTGKTATLEANVISMIKKAVPKVMKKALKAQEVNNLESPNKKRKVIAIDDDSDEEEEHPPVPEDNPFQTSSEEEEEEEEEDSDSD